MNIQDILEEAEKVAAYMNANVPDTMGYENMKTLLGTYFETNSSILELDDDSLRDSCMFCHCKSRSECQQRDCECHIHLDVSGGDLCVVISTRELFGYGDGPHGVGGCYVYKKGALFFVTKIFDDKCDDVWRHNHKFEDYWFQNI
jgi:hypothetical protein